MFQQVLRVYNQIQKYTKPLNESKILAGIFIVLINIASKFVDIRLSKPMEAYFRHTFSRHALVFAMAWMPTRDVFLSLVVSTVVIFIIDHLANDNSPWCALSEQFTGMHLDKEKERLEKERREKEIQEKEIQEKERIEKERIEKRPTDNENFIPSKEEVEHAIAILGRVQKNGYSNTPLNTSNTPKTSFNPSSSSKPSSFTSFTFRPANDVYT